MPNSVAATPENPSAELVPERDLKKQKRLLQSLLQVVEHFFGGFPHLFRSVHDPRHPRLIKYGLPQILTAAVLLFSFRLGSRRKVQTWLRDNEASLSKFEALFGLAGCPHGDTMNYVFKRLSVAEVQEVQTRLVETLIRQKVLYRYRLLDQYFLIVMDGTGVLTFSKRHCPQCLTQTHNGQTTYYHPVLEAKLVTSSGWAFSLLTEFIENPGEHPTKQDCELKAFYRLTARLKERLPRLPICLVLDGLYAGGPTFALCEAYHWKYFVVLQEADLPSIQEEFQALRQLTPDNQRHFKPTGPYKLQQDFSWVNDICYVDSERREHVLAVLECLETKQPPAQPAQTTRFKWVTNFEVTPATVATLANDGGRLRWKIENEGFNVQKNGGYGLKHRYSRNATASKIFYLVMQIAHLVFQLVTFSQTLRATFPADKFSFQDLAKFLAEAWRNLRLQGCALRALFTDRIQICFDTS